MFGGHGIAGTGQFFDSLGFRPGKTHATLAGVAELLGGLCFALGLFTPLAAAAIIAVMAVAVWMVHAPKGFFVDAGGYEYNAAIVEVAAGISMIGPGELSLDAALGLELAGVIWGLIALGIGLVAAVVALAVRATSMRGTTGRPQPTS